ncbi:MAG TPA: DUF2493 domain-containing protein [Candidatus Fimivivens faecavium]|nr:DUF2493 domain-containing protein [Candidatus Fimivivens faecavium]
MKVAVVGSRTLTGIDLAPYIPAEATAIVSGGAKGVDALAAEYARRRGLPLWIYRPDYDRYGRAAPIVRNRTIAENCDLLVAIWDGFSRGTSYTVEYAKKIRKPYRVYLIPSKETI